ncbi:HVO_0476 family zinc finger protein [Halobellus captivus]|uniref:HVO_0476 family zinc finger protein n=1 Tax=Halobellus captivus TaxID=2592614 RepID=UPI0011A7F4A5|nr:HVO_0476 family zinc finger protein [Halobellus captivus]
MSAPQDRIAVECPSCSPAEPTVHEVLKEGGGHRTVRCTECSHVHKVRIESETEVERDVIVSQDDESFSTTVDAPLDETVAVGEEFIVDSPEAIMLVRITGIEVGPEQRAEEATVEEVNTIWTRAVDNVTVNVTVNPKEGTGDRKDTRSFDLQLPGDHEFVVGETESFGDEEFIIKAIQVRQDAPEYRHGKFDHDGDMVYAKDVKRLYGTDQTTSAWSAW